MKCLTWNILADKYAPPEFSGDRLPLIIEYIFNLNADIIFLQEVDIPTFMDDFAIFEKDYNIYSHDICRRHNNEIGCAIIIRQDINVVQKQNASSALHLLVLGIGEEPIWLSCVHLKAGLTSGEPTRISQIKSIIHRTCEYPTIICGDFNDDLQPSGALFNILSGASFNIVESPNSCRVGGKKFPFDRAVSNKFEINYLPEHKLDKLSDHDLIEFEIIH